MGTIATFRGVVIKIEAVEGRGLTVVNLIV